MIVARETMNAPEKPRTDRHPTEVPPSDADIDALYGLEPVIEVDTAGMDRAIGAEFVMVHCPYCGEAFETSADTSAGSCGYVEDCQVCCQPIEMTLRVGVDGAIEEFTARRGDSS
jgi:hypothetical protein